MVLEMDCEARQDFGGPGLSLGIAVLQERDERWNEAGIDDLSSNLVAAVRQVG